MQELSRDIVTKVRKIKTNGKPTSVRGAISTADNTFEGHRNSYTTGSGDKKQVILAGKQNNSEDIDISWLKAASDSYKISEDINDYVLVDIPIVTPEIPNRNMQSFPQAEVSYFDPILGRLIYRTFVGKPTHRDHVNENPLKAKGVHFDSSLEYVKKYDIWKIKVLCGFDRTKDADLVNTILTNKRRGIPSGYSMGALVQSFLCSICGQVEQINKKCEHLNLGKGSIIDGYLVYQQCLNVNFIETSFVDDPADPTAISNEVFV